MNQPAAAASAVNSQLQSHLAQQSGGGAPSNKGGFHTMFAGDVWAAIQNIGHSLAKLGVLAKGGMMDLSALGKISPPSMNILASSKQVSPIKLGADFGGIGGGGAAIG